MFNMDYRYAVTQTQSVLNEIFYFKFRFSGDNNLYLCIGQTATFLIDIFAFLQTKFLRRRKN